MLSKSQKYSKHLKQEICYYFFLDLTSCWCIWSLKFKIGKGGHVCPPPPCRLKTVLQIRIRINFPAPTVTNKIRIRHSVFTENCHKKVTENNKPLGIM